MIYKKKPKDFTPIYHVASCFCEIDGKVLLLKRQDNKSEGNKWGIPAGKIEEGETAQEAITRELGEEIGLFKIESLEDLGKLYVRFPDYDFTFHIFRTSLSGPVELKLNISEHKEFAWVTPKEAVVMDFVLEQEKCFALHYRVKD